MSNVSVSKRVPHFRPKFCEMILLRLSTMCVDAETILNLEVDHDVTYEKSLISYVDACTSSRQQNVFNLLLTPDNYPDTIRRYLKMEGTYMTSLVRAYEWIVRETVFKVANIPKLRSDCLLRERIQVIASIVYRYGMAMFYSAAEIVKFSSILLGIRMVQDKSIWSLISDQLGTLLSSKEFSKKYRINGQYKQLHYVLERIIQARHVSAASRDLCENPPVAWFFAIAMNFEHFDSRAKSSSISEEVA